MKIRKRIFIILLLMAFALGACGPSTEPPPTEVSTSTQVPPEATENPTVTPIPPSPTPPPTTNIIIDGEADDWEKYPVNITDPTGDQKPAQSDLLEARFFMNDQFLYLLIKLDNNDQWNDMAFAVGFAENQNGQLNIRPNHHVDAGFYDTEFVDLPVSMEVGNFIEVKIPLDRLPAKLERIDFIRVFNGGDLADDSQNGEHKQLSRLQETEAVANTDGSAYSGELTLDTTWSGEVHVSGDITLSNGVILTIEPGTTVYLASNSDDTHRGNVKSEPYIDSHQDPVGTAEWDQNAITIDGRGGTINAIGSAEKPIVFRPEGESTSSAQWDGIYIEKGTIQYAKVLYAGRTAIQILSQKNDGSPKEQVEIAYNEVRFYHWAGIDSHTYNVWIHHNVVEGGGHQAITIGSGSIAEHNFLTHCQNAMFIIGVDVIVRNNIAVDCARGLQISNPRIPAGSEISITNNSVVQVQGPPDGWYYQGKLVYPSFDDGPAIGVEQPNLKLTIRNNILTGPFSYGIGFYAAPGSGSVVDYNLFWGVGQNFNGNSVGSHNLFSDPMLTEDFHLRPSSPAIDAGAPEIIDKDGSPSDLGAFGGDYQDAIGPGFLAPSAPASLTSACLSGETQLFASDFESGTDGWEFNPASAWSVVTDNESKVLQGSGHVHAYHQASWGDMIWRLKVKLDKGNVQLNFHLKDDQRYMVSFATEYGNLMKFPSGQFLQDAGKPHAKGVWHVVEIAFLQGRITVATDGVNEINYVDSAALGSGGIWLEVLEDSIVKFDDIYVCQP